MQPFPFDPATLPAAPVQLIEASAGTGKTWSITALYLRFILERQLPVEKILVLSFTEAATAELHERLRARLQGAVDAYQRFLNGEPPACDPFLAALIDHSRHPAWDLLLLKRALADIDQAAVLTIHGFCHRMLQQGAFESGMPFELELLADLDHYFQQIVQDYLNTVFHRDDPRLLGLLRQQGWWQWQQWARLAARHRHFPVLGDDEGAAEFERLWAATLAVYGQARESWRREREVIVELLARTDFQQKTRQQMAAGLLERLADHLAGPEPSSLVVPTGSEALTPEKLADPKAKICMAKDIKAGNWPRHPFFEYWRDYLAALAALTEHYRRQLLADLFTTVRRELPAWLYAAGRQSFDDLLHRLAEAVNDPQHHALAALIAARYPVALIDEFQDTDPIQYTIFKAVYQPDRDVKEATRLILIGDPKQAIYAFRGADIFAYLGAARDAGEQCYTMNINWRADRSLVAAINAMFAAVSNPFAVPEIAFHQVNPQPAAGDGWHGGEMGGTAPLQFLTLAPAQVDELLAGARSTKQLARTNLENEVPALVAADLVNLLRGGAELTTTEEAGRRPLRPADIAILVRENRQADDIQAALRQKGVKAVLHSRASVLHSREAAQLAILLYGLLEQAGEGQRRAAMISELLACTPAELTALEEDEKLWQQWLDDFSRWREIWRERGLMSMMRTIDREKGFTRRLLALADGERRLTNYRHLFELLHTRETEEHRQATALLKWFDEARAGRAEASAEAQELRLESDQEAVRILTIHRAKGLEFPVVYCPYLWKTWKKERRQSDEVLIYHDPEADRQGKISLLPSAEEHQLRAQEQFAEELRLLYVALTRAKHCCLVVWEAATGYQDTALAHLLHNSQPATFSERAELLADLNDGISRQPHWQWRQLPAAPAAVVPWQDPWQAAADVAGYCRRLRHGITPAWQVGSFSRMIAARSGSAPDFSQGRDHDATAQQPFAPLATARLAFEPGEDDDGAGNRRLSARVPLADFPAGLAAGNLLHRILELISFHQSSEHQRIIAEQAAAFGFSGAPSPGGGEPATVVAKLAPAVTAVLQTPLLPGLESFCLADIDEQQRLNEMPFTFPVCQRGKPLTAAALAAAFAEAAELPEAYPAHLAALPFTTLQGFMKGFIDLVFQHRGKWYIVDYKSNLLGACHADYQPGRLWPPMVEHHYILQYHLYTVALHRHLSARLPGYDYRQHFGGVFYLFLRGMHPELGPAAGVFQQRPAAGLIDYLSRRLFA
ncbi:MAG: exodeoxyribonuclease V subunit beta [Desulfurivibrio sp.]|nr:exodeoxyribonuclease V subunit beta [Desulfurivibrio sp.]